MATHRRSPTWFIYLLGFAALLLWPACSCGGGAGQNGADSQTDGTADGAVCVVMDQTPCTDGCSNTGTDPTNCGQCGQSCGADAQFCVDGQCAATCPIDRLVCGGSQCVDPFTSSEHCGACDNACGPGFGCADARCVPVVQVNPSGVNCTGNPTVDIPEVERCAGDLAESTFRWALCSCSSIRLEDPLNTDAFDSTLGPYDPATAKLGGGVGSNGFFRSLSLFDIGGALWAASASDGISTDEASFVRQDLSCGGNLVGRNPLEIDGDARVFGDVETTSTLDIANTLRQSVGRNRSSGVTFGTLSPEQVTIVDPCPCQASERIPVAAIVAAAATNNDNAAIGLDPDVLVSPSSHLRLNLPCGKYYLNGIQSDNSIVIAVYGKTAIFVGGDLLYNGTQLNFVVAPGAELDVFVAGRVSVIGQFEFGARGRPAASRLYIGGTGEGLTAALRAHDDTSLNGFIYAVEGQVYATHPITVYGGLFAGSFVSLGDTTLHYDRAILSAGDDCTPPDDTGCTNTCTDCGSTQACVGGTCGDCSDSADCCAPLKCYEGKCQLEVLL